jgi:hypothetical protein
MSETKRINSLDKSRWSKKPVDKKLIPLKTLQKNVFDRTLLPKSRIPNFFQEEKKKGFLKC